MVTGRSLPGTRLVIPDLAWRVCRGGGGGLSQADSSLLLRSYTYILNFPSTIMRPAGVRGHKRAPQLLQQALGVARLEIPRSAQALNKLEPHEVMRYISLSHQQKTL